MAPLNMSAYYQVASAHLYISCVTLWWEVICLQDAEERVHRTVDRKPCMLGHASLQIYLLKKRGIFRFKHRDGYDLFFSLSFFNSSVQNSRCPGFTIHKDLSFTNVFKTLVGLQQMKNQLERLTDNQLFNLHVPDIYFVIVLNIYLKERCSSAILFL